MSREHLKHGNRLYFMNDKNIRDGLVAQKVKSEHLVKFLQDKGIFVDLNSSKELLVNIVQTMRFDYFDYVYLSSLLEHHDKRDHQSMTELPTQFSSGKVNTAADNVRKSLADEEIELKITTSGKKTIVEMDYIDTDYSKAPMRQRTPRKGKIEIDFSSGTETSLQFPATEVGKKVKELLVKEMNNMLQEVVIPIEIDFEHETHSKRNEFFTSLLELPDYDLYDVVNVSVREATGQGNEGNEEDGDVTGELRNAALSGKNLLESNVYQGLARTRYNIYRISWKLRKIQVIKKTSDGDEEILTSSSEHSDCFTIEAKFEDKDRSKGFSYNIKTVQRYNDSKSRLNVTTGKLDKSEVEELSKVLYKHAVETFTSLTSGV
ncbi:hypothetical protein CSB62_08055 [Vibrio splendidus]|nr:hypothetical protein CSB62_08055 [Vibrio splendidus]